MSSLKRHLSALLLIVMLVTAVTPGVMAAETTISLTEAIQLAKAAFPEVSFPSEFQSSYAENTAQGTWNLRWYSTGEKHSEVNVSVNAVTGEITRFDCYAEPDQNQVYAPIPKLSQEQARRLAEAFLQKLIPEKLVQCLYNEQDPPRPYLSQRNWQQSYYFQFVRQVNGIPCPANMISVSVNGDTGAIISYALTWNELQFPSPENALSAAEAAKILSEQGELELQYFWPYVKQGETAKPVLAYSYPGINNIYIDAHTGKLETGGYVIYDNGQAKLGAGAAREDALTPQESAEVEYTEGLLTREQAEAKARELLAIPAELALQRANLSKDGSFPSLRTWLVTFYAKEREDYYNVRLDAKTGELLGMDHHWPVDAALQAGSLTPEQAKLVAEAFVKQYSAGKLSLVELEQMPTKEAGDQNAIYYSFNYRRMVDGIPFVSNYINVTVRGEGAGTVTNFDLRWVETEFPDPAIALSQAAAYSQLLAQNPLQQEYRLISEPAEEAKQISSRYIETELKAVLTYRPKQTVSTRFSPDKMLPIDYRGEVIDQKQQGAPQDVDGIVNKADIVFLSRVGIIQLENGNFFPSREITVGEWLDMLSRAAGWTTDNPIIVLPRWAEAAAGKPYAGAAQAAIAAGLILPGENVDMSKQLTREELAVFAVRALGYEKVAAIPGIYRLDCKDADQVTAARLGHVTIARGLGILVGGSDVYQPQASASRAASATVLMRMLRMER